MSQYTTNDSRDCLNATNSFNTNSFNTNSFSTNYYRVGDELSPLLRWLSPLDPGIRHSEIQERRVGNVGEWLMETEEFRRWCGLDREVEDDKAVLFCYGNPGVGKTFISSLVVDKLCDQTGGQHTAVTCFYFDFGARKEQTATSMLGSILKQVIRGTESVPEDIWQALQKQKMAVSGCNPQLGDIVKILQLVTSSQRTFMDIDALDKCTAVQRFRLFDSLKEIIQKSPGARIFVTGRPHICPEIETRLAGRVTSVSVGPASDDIVRFLRVRLSEDETPDAMDASLEAEILERIPGSISDMFLLASLNIEAILQESTIYRRRDRLSKMADGLGLEGVYGATIERIKAQGGDKSRLGMGALMWISYAEVPLSPDALCHALAIELGSTDLNRGNIPSITTLVSCCQGLIRVDKGRFGFGLRMRLLHFTLKEYCSAHPDTFSKPHSAMAEICLTYLNFQRVKALPDNFPDDIDLMDDHPFLQYCSLNWGVHMQEELSDHSRSLALQLLQEYNGHISAQYVLSERPYGQWESSDFLSMFSGLHCASFLGIVEMVVALIDMGCCDLSVKDFWGRTPLSWAALGGHEEVVKILLERYEVYPGKPDNNGRTPLSYAAEGGCDGVVKLLLGWEEVDPNKPDKKGQTPLSHAAEKGWPGVVKVLLGRKEVDPDKPDNHGGTPLSHAAFYGFQEVVKLLLGRKEVDPNKPSNSGGTPLLAAASNSGLGVVKILLAREDVNPEMSSRDGWTPLLMAAWRGEDEMVRLLLGRGEVNPDKQDDGGRTVLSWAAERGRGGMIQMLLGREEVNPDKPDNNGRTPLSYAAGSGCEGGVNQLLGREEVDPDKPDSDGLTPLSHAARSGREEVVKVLLERQEVDPSKPDNNGRTPLSYAAEGGYEGVVKVLLGREEVDPDKPGDNGRTPLSYAAGGAKAAGVYRRHSWGEYIGVVKMLLRQENVNPDRQDNQGRTPLSYATANFLPEIARLLLRREEVNPNRADNDGKTPLMWAPSHWHQETEDMIQSYRSVAHSAIGDLSDTPSRKSLPFLLFPTKPVTGFVPAHLLRANDIPPAGNAHMPSDLAPTDSQSNSID